MYAWLECDQLPPKWSFRNAAWIRGKAVGNWQLIDAWLDEHDLTPVLP